MTLEIDRKLPLIVNKKVIKSQKIHMVCFDTAIQIYLPTGINLTPSKSILNGRFSISHLQAESRIIHCRTMTSRITIQEPRLKMAVVFLGFSFFLDLFFLV